MLIAMSLLAKHFKKTMTDGSTVEEYFWEGALHRVDGAAMVRRNADGSWIEQYYRMGKLHRRWPGDHLAQVGRQHESCVLSRG
jgi:hypothetical protein